MKFLHTSDWHIGKKLEGRSRLEEQRLVLGSLVKKIKSESIDVVLIAGDVYDTFTPSSEGENLFFDTIADITDNGVAVVIVSGNHDDPLRLSASKELAEKNGVFFYGGQTSVFCGRVNCPKRGKDFVVFEKNGESVYIALLPYPTELRMKENHSENETYESKVKRYIDEALDSNDKNFPVVLVAHVFMLGGKSGESERNIELGGTRILPPDIIPESVVYTALGHLHKRQVVSSSRNIIYSGSILQYAFDECSFVKSSTVFDIENGTVKNLYTIEYEGYKKLKKITVENCEKARNALATTGDTFVEVTLNLDAPPSQEAIKEIVGTYPNAVLRINYKGCENVLNKGRVALGSEELFKEYYKFSYGSDVPPDVLQLFLKKIHEIEVCDETDSD